MNASVRKYIARNRWIASAVITLFLVGCQASLPPLKPDTTEGPITYMMSVRQNTSAGLDRLTTKFEVAKREDTADYRSWSDWWCPRYARGTNPPPPPLQGLTKSYCEAHGGQYDRNVACITRTEPRTVLFYMSVFKGVGCEGTAITAQSLVIEPKPGREHSVGYMAALRRAGYAPPDVLAAEQTQRETTEANRLRREMPLLTKCGTRVCQDRSYLSLGFLTFYGFVEDVLPNQSKIKVAVNGPTGHLVPSGWQPETIWAAPSAWRVCE